MQMHGNNLYVSEIVTSTDNAGKPASVVQLRDMYGSCMDTAAMEEAGIPQSLLDSASAAGELGGWPAVTDTWAADK